jgi:hypothetical protein
MTPVVYISLDLVTFEALDGTMRAHRANALASPDAKPPMEAFQEDLVIAAKRLGFVPPEPGVFWINIQPGGRNTLCWSDGLEAGPAQN